MQKIKAIIIDDEVRAQTLLKSIITEYCKEVDVIECCSDLPNAVKTIRKLKPDIIFLDIEMPGHSGLELLEFFNEDEIQFATIFTTAYNQYSINAIKMAAFDYLLKPIEPEELVKTIERFKKTRVVSSDNLSLLNNKIAVPTSNGMRFINTDEIICLKADNTYTEVYLSSNEKIIVSRILKNFEDTLKNVPSFFRCNKSYIINYHFVSEYVKSDGGYIIMNNKMTIPISPDKVGDFLELSSIVKR